MANFKKDPMLLQKILAIYCEKSVRQLMIFFYITRKELKYLKMFHYEKTANIGLFKAVLNELAPEMIKYKKRKKIKKKKEVNAELDFTYIDNLKKEYGRDWFRYYKEADN